MNENTIRKQVTKWLQLQHPKVIYRWDLAADIRLTIGQAVRVKELHNRRGYPDLFIAEPVGNWAGMFLELKKDKNELLRKDGFLKDNRHNREQLEFLRALRHKGYFVQYGLGFEDAIMKIDRYLKNDKNSLLFLDVNFLKLRFKN
jgi:hypothetical protein